MLNSYTFGNTLLNSVLSPQIVTPPTPPSTGGGRKETRKIRVFNREFINIVGQKLFINKEQIEIIATKLFFNEESIPITSSILLAGQLHIDLTSSILIKEAQDLLFLQGKVLYPVQIKTPVLGTKMFLNTEEKIVKGKYLILSKQLQLLSGTKLISSDKYIMLKGFKKVPCKQNNLICGQKDISEILEALDMSEIKRGAN